MKLTAKAVKAITAPGRYYDDTGIGLFLDVRTSTRAESGIRAAYVQRVTINGRRKDIGLGSVKWLTLTEARAVASANLKTARTGGDPRTGRRRVPTFADGLDAVIAVKAPTWRHPKTAAQWRASLRDYAPALLPMRVDAIGPGDVLDCLEPVWNTKRETASRVRQRIAAVMDWSIARGHRDSNPVDATKAALPQNGNHREHFRALPYGAVGGALATVRDSGAYPTTKLAFEFLVLTAGRSSEIRGMLWSEVQGDTWTVPASRMKAGREHRVPLSARALQVLDDARELADGSGLVFPSITGRTMSDSTLSKLVKELGIAGTPHGMRSAFRDFASERTNTAHAVMEAALAHTIRDKAEAAYARSDLVDKRRALMDAWSRYLAAESTGRVVAIR